jgi:hypothetical protein
MLMNDARMMNECWMHERWMIINERRMKNEWRWMDDDEWMTNEWMMNDWLIEMNERMNEWMNDDDERMMKNEWTMNEWRWMDE